MPRRTRRPLESAAGSPRANRRSALRVVIAGVLLVGGVVSLLSAKESLALLRPLGGVVLVIVGIVLLLGPWWLRIARDLVLERQARVRAEERDEIATRIHDSVLQTLALIQRRADDPQKVVQLARLQERELRSWLFEGRAPNETDADLTFAAGVRQIQQDVEARYGVPVEAVTVGDCELDDNLNALLAAAREATVNAAKWSGASVISLFAEVETAEVSIVVRDRGQGFDPEAVPEDRKGLAESIHGRMTRRGGTAAVSTAKGEGAKVTLKMPRTASAAAGPARGVRGDGSAQGAKGPPRRHGQRQHRSGRGDQGLAEDAAGRRAAAGGPGRVVSPGRHRGADMSAPRVVLVDDHGLFRSGVRAELGRQVEVVGEADDVQPAIELIGSVLPDVVLLDVHLPGGGGQAVVEAIKASHPEVRFLALSASDAPEDVIAVIRAGARGYVTKTISTADLADAVRRVAAGDAVFSHRLAGFVLDAFAATPSPGEVKPSFDPELDQLTSREREVLRLIAQGYTYKEIARELYISVKTVESHVSSVLRKLQLSTRHQLTRWAAERRLA
jgi:DNA-binding NarL/FixJ family response regulator